MDNSNDDSSDQESDNIATSMRLAYAIINKPATPAAFSEESVERAVSHIWQLGLNHPNSGLVPIGELEQLNMRGFLDIWALYVLPAIYRHRKGVPFDQLASLNKTIKSQRMANAKSRRGSGPFWNGNSRMPSIVEIIAAPLANQLLHSSVIPDTPELGALAAWLAAISILAMK